MTDIFVSYSRKDSATARKLFEAFKALDLNPWVDWEDIPPAVDWLDQILQGIEKSDAFIFLVSPDSAISEVCKVEIAHAAKNNKRIIPVLVRDVDTKTVIPTIREINWIYLRDTDKFEEAIEKVKVGINLDIEWVSAHRRLQVLALEWDRRKDPSLLLRGGDLRSARNLIFSAQKKEPKLTPLQQSYIEHSNQDERRKVTLWIATAVAVIVMAVLSFTAVYQARKASENAALAQANERIAQENEVIAIQNERIARDLQKIAETSENIAEAQRSAARAQIYQTRTGELYTSTLLAIDSIQRNSTTEAEQILRKNISLLPIPIAQSKQKGAIHALMFNPVGDSFLTASGDGATCVWMFPSGENKFCVPSSGSVEAAVYSPDGKIIVVGDQSGEVLIINAETGVVENTFNFNTPIWDLSISPNGNLLAVARDDGKISVIGLQERIFNFDLFTFGSVYVAKFSPDGDWLASGTSAGVTTFWNLSDGRIISGTLHRGQVFALAFSPDSRTVLSGGSDSYANLTVTATGNNLFHILNEDAVEDVAFNSDGSWYVTVSSDARIRVWDTRTGKEKIRMLQDSFVNEVEVSPNNQWIATTGYDKTIRIWSAATGAEIIQIPLTSSGNYLKFSPDGNYIISGDQSGNITAWDISALASAVNYIQFDESTQAVLLSNTDEWLAASTDEQVWLLTYEQLSSLKLTVRDTPILNLDAPAVDLVASPDSNWLAVSNEIGEIILYNLPTKTKILEASTGAERKIIFSSDSQFLIAGDSNGEVVAINPITNNEEILISGGSRVGSLAVYQNQLAIGLLNKIILYDLSTKTILSEIQSPGDHTLMTFSPDGIFLASSNSSGQIYIWKLKVDEYQLLNIIPSEPAFSMIFNPQSTQLLIGVSNNVYILDPDTGDELARIRHKDIVSGLSFSADGTILATASLKAVQFWDMQKIEIITQETLESTACSRLTQNFDAAQWEAFFGDEPFRKLCENLLVP